MVNIKTFPKGPSPESAQVAAGFRFGSGGSHTSRTLMLKELQAVMDHAGRHADRFEYKRLVIEDNCLGKLTSSTRRISFQRLSELYSLDHQVLLFRVLRRLWPVDAKSQPHLAVLLALVRDPLLRCTAPAVLNLKDGDEFARTSVEAALRTLTQGRLNDSILAKVVRNCASSWAQAGHLEGRTFKHRQQIKPHFVSVIMALAVGHVAGYRGEALFSSPWMQVLDVDPVAARGFALEAKRAGLVDLRISDKIVDLQLDKLDSSFSLALEN